MIMTQVERFLCLAWSAILLLMPCASVSATEALTETAYVLAGEPYALPATVGGQSVTWDKTAVNTAVPAKRVVTGQTADGTPVELIVNVGMYTPIFMDNFEDRAVGSAVTSTSEGFGVWNAYSGVGRGNGTVVAQESTNNKYFVTRGGWDSGDSVGPYSRNVMLTNSDATALTGKLVFEFKLKIPASSINEKSEILFLYESANKQQQSYGSAYKVAQILASTDGYFYTDYHDGSIPGVDVKTYKLADYNEQWISLRLEMDTNAAGQENGTIFCNGNEVGKLESAFGSASLNKITHFAVRIASDAPKGEGAVYLDDFAVYKNDDATIEKLYYGDVTAPEFDLKAGENSSSALISAPLATQNGTPYGKTAGVIAGKLNDTSMAGKFYRPLVNYEGKEAIWNVYPTTDFDFEGSYTPDSRNTLEAPLGDNNHMLKIARNENPDNRSHEEIGINVPANWQKLAIEFDMLLNETLPSDCTYTYIRLCEENRNYPIFDFWINPRADNYYYLYSNNGTFLEGVPYSTTKPEHIKLVFDKTAGNITCTLNGSSQKTKTLPFTESQVTNANKALGLLNFYTHDTKYDIYFDNISINSYDTVTSVTPPTINSQTVVVGEKVTLPAYADTLLSNNTAGRLPIIWDKADTASAGTKTVYGYVDGYRDATGGVVTLNASYTVELFPYTMAIGEDKLTVTKLGAAAPTGKLYLASIDAEGELRSVSITDINGETAWSAEGTISLPAVGQAGWRALLLDSNLTPLSLKAE